MSRTKSEENPNSADAIRLGAFVFRPTGETLVDANGSDVHLRKQTSRVLAQLVSHRGEVVPKQVLFDTIWAGTAVTDDSLVQCISEIRRALNDRDHAIVQTAAKKGYRLIGQPALAERGSPEPPPTDQPSVAVLAFEDFSTGPDAGYLSDAVAEGIIAELSRFPELAVIARNSSFAFRDKPTEVRDIAAQLGVRYLLEGSQQRFGNRLRVTTQLIDTASGHHLWSEVYDRDLRDLFAVQDDIVRRVVATVAQKIIKLEGRRRTPADHAERTALLYHLEARQHLIRFTPAANKLAYQANLAAIDADPTQPYGHAGLVFVYINGHRWGWTNLSRAEALAAARASAQRALDLGPDYYDSHAAMAYVCLEDNDLDQAIARGERAVALNPNDIYAMCDLAEFLGYDGQYAAAEVLLRKAMRLDPLHPDWTRWTLAWVQWLKGDCDAALRTMNAMADIPPMAYRVLALIHVARGQPDLARAAVEKILEYDPSYALANVRRNYEGKFSHREDYARVMDGLRSAGLRD